MVDCLRIDLKKVTLEYMFAGKEIVAWENIVVVGIVVSWESVVGKGFGIVVGLVNTVDLFHMGNKVFVAWESIVAVVGMEKMVIHQVSQTRKAEVRKDKLTSEHTWIIPFGWQYCRRSSQFSKCRDDQEHRYPILHSTSSRCYLQGMGVPWFLRIIFHKIEIVLLALVVFDT